MLCLDRTIFPALADGPRSVRLSADVRTKKHTEDTGRKGRGLLVQSDLSRPPINCPSDGLISTNYDIGSKIHGQVDNFRVLYHNPNR